MTRRLLISAVVFCLSTSSLISAQQDSAKRPAPKKPDLELVATRQMDLDTDEGTWISLDVSPDGRTIVFDLLGDLLPEFSLRYTLRSGMEELLERYRAHGFSRSDFDGPQFVRLRSLAARREGIAA